MKRQETKTIIRTIILPINLRAVLFLGAHMKGEEKNKARQSEKDDSANEHRCPNLK
jgi:hypothetical protein